MKKILLLSTAALAALLIAACGRSGPVLHIYNWDAYMSPEAIELFEKKFNCRVVLDTFDSNEAMYAKLKAGATGYDVIFPSSYQAAIMQAEGMLLDLSVVELPNLANVDPDHLQRFAIDNTMAYSVPYMTGSTGIAFRESILPDFEPSWAVFENDELSGRMTLLNDMRETLGAALKFLGFSLNSTNPDEINMAADKVIEWKRNIARFENEGYKQGIASREFHVVHGYSGDILQVVEENEDYDILYAFPKEGFSVWEDVMVVPADSDAIELALQFVDFMHDPEIAVLNMEYNYYRCPNTVAYDWVSAEIKQDPTIFVPADLLRKGELIRPLDAHLQLYISAWDRVKAAR